ncbi:hypothetical protein ACFLTC_02515, partial [Chloroflexota bacterium]
MCRISRLAALVRAKDPEQEKQRGKEPGAGTGRSERRASSSAPWAWPDFAALLLASLAILVAIRPFWQPGIASSVDMLMGIYRVFELDRSWQNGILYPR